MLVARRDVDARPGFANLDIPLQSQDWKRYESAALELGWNYRKSLALVRSPGVIARELTTAVSTLG